ncbi:MAG: glycan-binding surface protein [Chitinophagaceae bacterium]
MKTINKTLMMLFMAVAVIGIYTSCKKDRSKGEPRIDYVRVTNPTSSDSLLVGAGQGQLIAIVGQNLEDAVEIWFNDQRAVLTPTYITSTTILVSVPSKIPTTITNKIRIIFSNGKELEHRFQVQISKPTVTNMVSEYVNAGDIATVRGNYFYAPLTVTFTGGVTGEIVSIKDQEIQVRVPAGAQPGPIKVKTNFGETESQFLFRDNRNLFITGDPHEGWWGTYLVTNPGAGDPAKISGNYYRFKKAVKAWVWDTPEVAGGPANSMSTSKNIPDAALLKPEEYNLKFEINTLKPYTSNRIVLNVGLSAEDNNNYAWNPPYDSKGQWNTIVIPFEDIVKSYAVRPVVNPNGYWTRILVFGPGDLDADIAFDNFRVVPKLK